MGPADLIPPDDPLLDVLRHADPEPARSPDCLDDETVAALADGELEPGRREASARHLARCTACRRAVAEVVTTLNDPAVAGKIPAPRAARGLVRRVAPWVAAAAATVVVTLGVQRIADHPSSPVTRDETLTTAAAPAAIAPRGGIDGQPVFRWSKVGQADLYHLVVFNEEGAVIWETRTTDTTAAIPATARLDSGATYLWKVEARTDFDRWVASPLTTFRPQRGRNKP